MSLRGRQWIWPRQNEELASDIAGSLGLTPALAQLLINRGVENSEQARAFLCPSEDQFHSPWQMKGMDVAVQRLLKALENKEKIMIYGDYDADGITATVILVEVLGRLGAEIDYYLPSRSGEGYGLHIEPLKKFIAEETDLVVTVDCGTNAVEEAAYASSMGLDLIITDHHQPLETLPGVVAVLNPLQEKCSYPFKELSGAGIAFKLASALLEKLNKPLPRELLDLAALGTTADVVPLLDENRSIVHSGLEVLRSRQRPGFKALMKVVNLDRERISSGSLAFILAPSVNATGRMGEALPAARLFLEQDPEKAEELALHLHEANRKRRTTEQKILQEAETAAEQLLAEQDQRVITLAGENWHHGVIGIVASRLVEKYNRPVCLVALEDQEGRGSARSVPGFDITGALAGCSSLLERFGGHEQAAGFTIQPGRIEALREGLNCFAETNMADSSRYPGLHLEAELTPADLQLTLAEQVDSLQPFGAANPAPLFGSRGWELKSWRLVGSDQKHLKLNLRQNGRSLDPIVFSGASLARHLEKGRLVDLALKVKKGYFNNRETLETEVNDLKYSDIYCDGRLELIDRRNCRDRLARYKEVLQDYGREAVVFTSTSGRAKKLKKQVPEGELPLVVTSGALNGDIDIPEGKGPVILFDLPIYEGLLSHILKTPMQEVSQKIYLLFNNADLQRNRYLLEISLPSAEQLGMILNQVAPGDCERESLVFSEPVKKKLNPDAGPAFWERVENIFSEAGLLANGKIIAAEKTAANVDWPACLEVSPTYRAISEKRKECEQFQKTLLEAAPDKLVALIYELTGDR